uniref:Uncharacterized protein n=1 Tax=Chromera velia CCMP2878 TaxID=1169474 RepID=A0A0G4HKE0_9ALVE|eukprot:Cvel_28379.t1-p1 / transcript=Cvel_28379.t1 / gene=Cvel_28379 / organism=Chromera_velia_CCMP2878 / gene_product=Protein NLRC3, putative / transcript_product=Protein NLRC3, putative / location=Cvel_scaffold3703:2275-5938(+) / protein_length=1078 / sequence_SO=supercontig / SO=protein_coding / is_pseudo=false
MSRTARERYGEGHISTEGEENEQASLKSTFSLPEFFKEFGPRLLVQFADIGNDILQFLSICFTQQVLSATALVGRLTVQQVGAFSLSVMLLCSFLSIKLDYHEHIEQRGIDEKFSQESKQHLKRMKQSKLYYTSRQIGLLVIEDGISLVFSGSLIYLQHQEVFSVIGFNLALTLLGFTYMLLKHLADATMSRRVLQRLEKKRGNVQPSFVFSLCHCFQRGGEGGSVSPQTDAAGETERLLLHTRTNTNTPQEAHTGGDGGEKDLEVGGGIGGEDRGGVGAQTAETDRDTGGEGGGGEDEGEAGSALERQMEAEVKKEGGVLFWCLLFVSYSLHHSINESMDVLQDVLSVGSVLNSAVMAAQPMLPPFLIDLGVRAGISEASLSSLTAGTCAYVVLGICLYCYVGALFARLCIKDVRWMLWASWGYKRGGGVGVRVVIVLQCLVALPFFPVLLTAYLMNKEVYYAWWDRQKKFSNGGTEGEAFLSNALFCFFLLEDVPSVLFNLLLVLGEGNDLISIQGANLLSTLFGLAVRVMESEGQRRVRTDEAVSLGEGGGRLRVTKENIDRLTASLRGTGSTHIRLVEIREDEFSESSLDAFLDALVSRNRPSLKKILIHKRMMRNNKSSIVSFLVRLKEALFLSLQTLNLSTNKIGDEGAKALAEALRARALPSLQSLNLSTNKIGDEGVKALAKVLKQTTLPFLQSLDLSDNEIGAEGAKFLAEALKVETFPSLQSLELEHNRIRAEGATALAAALKEVTLPSLQSLNLYYNQIGDEGVKAIAGALKAGTCPSLQSLDLKYNQISTEGAKALVEVMKASAFPSLQSLDLENNNIGAEGAEAFAEALKARTLPSLQSLNLINNSGSEAVQKEINGIIRQNKACAPPQEDRKNEGNQGREGDTGGDQENSTDAIVEEVMRSFLWLFFVTKLDMGSKNGGKGIGDKGAKALAEALKARTLPYLQSLDLSSEKQTRIGAEGTKALVEALGASAFPYLQRLDLHGLQIGDEGAEALAEALKAKAFPSLHSLHLSRNQIGDKGAKALAEALKARPLPSLQRLFLWENQIGDKGKGALAEVLQPSSLIL